MNKLKMGTDAASGSKFLRAVQKSARMRLDYACRQSATLSAIRDQQRTVLIEKAKSPEEIPGPIGLPFIGTLYKYLPWGEYSLQNIDSTAMKMYKKYGPVVRQELPGGETLYHIMDPDDIATMFRHEGAIPRRMPLYGLAAVREDRKLSPGIVNENGEAWKRLRKHFQRDLMRPMNVANFVPAQEEIANDLVDRIRHIRDESGEVTDLIQEMFRWGLESIGQVVLDRRLGLLSAHPDPDAQTLIDCTQSLLSDIFLSVVLWPLHKNKKTKTYKRLGKNYDVIWGITQQYIAATLRQLEEEPTDNSKPSYIRALLKNDDVTFEEVVVMTSDMLFLAIDTSSHFVLWALYHLAKNPHHQELLYEDLVRHVGSSNNISSAALLGIPYLKAVVQETFRLTPVIGGSVRKLPVDVVMSGYRMPAGSTLLYHCSVPSWSEKYFDEPTEFRPQRWLNSENKEKHHPFAVLPFGHGARICMGKRLAIQGSYMSLLKIILKYKVEYHGEEVGMKTRLVNQPDRPINMKFLDRHTAHARLPHDHDQVQHTRI